MPLVLTRRPVDAAMIADLIVRAVLFAAFVGGTFAKYTWYLACGVCTVGYIVIKSLVAGQAVGHPRVGAIRRARFVEYPHVIGDELAGEYATVTNETDHSAVDNGEVTPIFEPDNGETDEGWCSVTVGTQVGVFYGTDAASAKTQGIPGGRFNKLRTRDRALAHLNRAMAAGTVREV